MAGDWIKMRCGLDTDPRVVTVALALDLDEFDIVGRLHKLWAWAGEHTQDGHAPSVTGAWLDRFLRCPGLAAELERVGWLDLSDGVNLPDFDRHNSQSAKQRALSRQRKAASRASGEGCHALVPKVSRSERDKSVTREEKRREEKRESAARAREAQAEGGGIAVAEVVQTEPTLLVRPPKIGPPPTLEDDTWASWVRATVEHVQGECPRMARLPVEVQREGAALALRQLCPPEPEPGDVGAARRWQYDAEGVVERASAWLEDLEARAQRGSKGPGWIKAALAQGPAPEVFHA